MNDLDLLAMPKAAFNALVGDAFKLYREGDMLGLAQLPLVGSSLTDAYFLNHEPKSQPRQSQAMQTVLRWMVDKLSPGGKHSWTAARWRHYNILHHFYLHETRVTELADHMAIAEQTWYQLRPRAIEAAATLLREALVAPQYGTELKNYGIASRYDDCEAQAQRILRLMAIFRQPIPNRLIYQMEAESNQARLQPAIQALLDHDLLLTDAQGAELLAPPEIRPYLLKMLQPQERIDWHQAAGIYYQTQHDYLEAAWHFRAANNAPKAALVLIEQVKPIIDSFQVEALRDLLNEFRFVEINDKNLWAELKLVDGRVASHLEDVDTALARYGEALSATDLQIKSRAYFERGQAFKLKNLDEALTHYGYCIELLVDSSPPHPLLIQAFIERAWIFIQDRQDWSRAEQDLGQVEALISRDNRTMWADLHNAWGELYYRRQDLAGAIEHQLQAWLAAHEIQDGTRQIRMGHNLGQFYVEAKQYQQGLDYLQRTQALAQQTGHRTAEAACYKSIGACYFWLEQYDQAISHYQQAYQIFAEMGNLTWQAYVCYDLAEVYLLTAQPLLGQQQFEQATQLAQRLDNEDVLSLLADLARQYPAVKPATADLHERQQQAFAFVKQHGQISNRQYRELTGISQKQAVRDLKDMVTKDIFAAVGQGRARRYVLGQ